MHLAAHPAAQSQPIIDIFFISHLFPVMAFEAVKCSSAHFTRSALGRHDSCYPLLGEQGHSLMIKRITRFSAIIASSTFMFTGVANASPETAEDWGARAGVLYGMTTKFLNTSTYASNSQLEVDYLEGLTQFAIIAGRLAVWVDTSGGAKDFGCIYRGMAEEAELQLETLETVSTQEDAAAALTRIATMLDDAQSIAVASAHAARTGTSSLESSHCPASAIPLDTYLTGHGS